MEAPGADIIEQLKKAHEDRELRLVEFSEGGETYPFIITGPTEIEYKKYCDDLLSARDKKTEKERIESAHSAIQNAALAQIRWPGREETRRIFALRPALSDNFAEELHKAAGMTVEVRSKKL
jgi:hypothetical protein